MLATIIQFKTTTVQNQYVVVFLDKWHIDLNLLLGVTALVTLVFFVRASNASRRQNELRTVPSLSLQSRNPRNPRQLITTKLVLQRHDSKLIFDIKINPFYDQDETNGKVSKYRLEPNMRQNFIPEGAEPGEIELGMIRDGESVDEDHEIHALIVSFSKAPLIITFKDAQNIKYFTLLQFNKGVTKMSVAPTKIRGIRGIRYVISLANEKCRYIWLKISWLLGKLK